MKNNLSMRIYEKNVHQKRVGGSVAQPPGHPGTSSAKAAMAHQESEWHPALGEANVLERRPLVDARRNQHDHSKRVAGGFAMQGSSMASRSSIHWTSVATRKKPTQARK
jgi:hypothetical protein